MLEVHSCSPETRGSHPKPRTVAGWDHWLGRFAGLLLFSRCDCRWNKRVIYCPPHAISEPARGCPPHTAPSHRTTQRPVVSGRSFLDCRAGGMNVFPLDAASSGLRMLSGNECLVLAFPLNAVRCVSECWNLADRAIENGGVSNPWRVPSPSALGSTAHRRRVFYSATYSCDISTKSFTWININAPAGTHSAASCHFERCWKIPRTFLTVVRRLTMTAGLPSIRPCLLVHDAS